MRCKPTGLAILAFLLFVSPAAQTAEIPLGASGGIYTLPVQINGSVTMQFLVDPGAGVVVIPLTVLRQLVLNGTVTQSDVIGLGAAQFADNSMHLTAKVRLRELRIGNSVVKDVLAVVSPGLSEPLLGQSFFRRFATVTFDNRRQLLILSEDPPAAPAQYPAPASAAPNPYPMSGGGYGPANYGAGFGR